MNRVLVIDDDQDLCDLLNDYLTAEGFQVDLSHNGEAGAEQAVSGDYSLVVLDVMLPGCSGFDVLRRIRSNSATPVLMLTARGDEVDRIVGLEMGADDYLPKPFNPRELVARIRAVQRRLTPAAPPAPPPQTCPCGDLQIDPGSRSVTSGGIPVDLTSVEYSLLEILLERAGQVVSREDLSRLALGRELGPYDRSIDVHISSLRRKLGPDCNDGERIRSVRGVGYFLARKAS